MLKDLMKAVNELESECNIHSGFFESLLRKKENDWSFLIKLFALVEASLTYLLITKLGTPEIEERFSRLNLTGDFSKLNFLEDFGLLKEYSTFLKALAKTRNKFIHDISMVDCSFELFLLNTNN